jgi:hypothetical protein
METYRTYLLRDEMEIYFHQLKEQKVSDRQRNWSEEGNTGRFLILFVALILSSHVRHVRKRTRLRDLFPSSLEMVDKMKPIRCVEHTNRAKAITPFVGAQIDICEVFGFDIPKCCAPTHKSRQQPKQTRGRPPKPRVEIGL